MDFMVLRYPGSVISDLTLVSSMVTERELLETFLDSLLDGGGSKNNREAFRTDWSIGLLDVIRDRGVLVFCGKFEKSSKIKVPSNGPWKTKFYVITQVLLVIITFSFRWRMCYDDIRLLFFSTFPSPRGFWGMVALLIWTGTGKTVPADKNDIAF